jgi:2-aminoadipate transaminase
VRIAEILKAHDALLIEDDPYSSLRYVGEPVAPIKSIAPDNVVYVGTLSKVLAPGLRVGFCVAPQAILRWLVVAKQGTDLHTGTFSQAIAAEYLLGGFLAEHLPEIVRIYAPRRQAMLDALEAHMPDTMRWSRPEGGMFVWVEGPKGLDTDVVHVEALKAGVAFVPGRVFFTDPGRGRETMRLNFTKADESTLAVAVGRLAGAIRNFRF